LICRSSASLRRVLSNALSSSRALEDKSEFSVLSRRS
jgi:hypothetical protein